MVEEEELQFHEEYMNEKDPSILHFLLASGDDVWYNFCHDFIYCQLSSILKFMHQFAGLKQATP